MIFFKDKFMLLIITLSLAHLRDASTETVSFATYRETKTLRLVIPARPFCNDPNALIDHSLRSCVAIDRSIKQIPSFSPCPGTTVLNARNCVGRLESDLEHSCPLRYGLNEHAQCVKATTYIPPDVVCPEGFQFRHDRRTGTYVCKKESWINVLYTHEEHRSNDEHFCEPPKECPSVAKALCPHGYRLIRHPPPEVSHHSSRQLSNVSAGKPLCYSRVIVPPQPRKLCLKRFRWSPTLAGCLKLDVVEATDQCPKPDIHIGYGKGDWDTPAFHYDTEDNTCVATTIPALHPQCPPGWALEGLTSPSCFLKRFTPIQYDCRNAVGFYSRWNTELNVAECELVLNMAPYSPGVSYLTRRSEINAKYLQLTSRPWTLEKGFKDGVITEESEIEEKEKNQEETTSPDRLVPAAIMPIVASNNFTEFTPLELDMLQKELQNYVPGQQLPFEMKSNSSESDPLVEFDTITKDLMPLSEPPLVRSRLRRSIAWRSFDTFHSGLPGTRQDLLDPRDPGSFSPSFESPMSTQKKLHVYAKKRGLF